MPHFSSLKCKNEETTIDDIPDYQFLLNTNANPKNITDWIHKLRHVSIRNKMIQDLKMADNQWSPLGKKAAKLIADDILSQ